jgi:lipopolysaccharide transport system permease protein
MPKEKDENWDLIIRSASPFFDLNLKDIWKYRDLVFLFVRRDFTATYKQTILGPLWHFIQPVFTTIMFVWIFSKLAGIPTDNIQPVLFYMSGITFWNYFSACLTGASNTFLSNAGIFGKVYFPRMVSPLSIVISNIVRFGIQFLLLIVVMIFYSINGSHQYFGWSWLLIIPLLIIMAGTGLGLGIVISSLTTKYRDFNVLIGFGVQLLMYATPIAYPLSFLMKKSYSWLAIANPLTPLVEGFRFALFHTGTFTISSLIYSLVFMLASLLIGLFMFSKVEKNFMDTV